MKLPSLVLTYSQKILFDKSKSSWQNSIFQLHSSGTVLFYKAVSI